MIPTILLVDHDPETMKATKDRLRDFRDKCDIITAESGNEAIEVIRSKNVELVLLDVVMGEMDGIETLKRIKSIDNSIMVVMLTVLEDSKRIVDSFRQGAYDYLVKHCDKDEFAFSIKRVLDEIRLRKDNVSYRALITGTKNEEMLGKSPVMLALFDIIEKVARVNATILIKGETGAGKELVARRIHRLWSEYNCRSKEKFVAVNCAAIPKELIESELFGHEKGAFTSASERKLGMFELADGGTILLDEISELSKETQAKLLRVLQEKEVRRVGGRGMIRVDVRIISATNHDIEELVDSGSFRRDLYFRLNVIPVKVPSLRDHRSDIPLLAEHFVKRYSADMKVPAMKITGDALRMLRDKYDWPGNVRELENVIQRALILSKGRVIDVKDLPLRSGIEEDINIAKLAYSQIVSIDTNKESFEKLRRGIKKQMALALDRLYIEKIFSESDGSIKEIIEKTGINRTYLYKIADRSGVKLKLRDN